MSDPEPTPETWHPDLLAVADSLRDLGYDIETSPGGDGPIRDFIARRDLADRAVMLAIDASGRFRAAITWVVGEWPSQDEIAGVPVRVVDAVSRAVTVTGLVDSLDQVLPVAASLDANAPWASIAKPDPASSGKS